MENEAFDPVVQQKILLVSMTITNRSPVTQTIELSRFCGQSRAWSNGIHLPLFRELNESTLSLSLASKESIEVLLPYALYAFQFQDKDWTSVEGKAFDLVLALHPEKKIVHLDVQ
jgi:hypothetical protein